MPRFLNTIFNEASQNYELRELRIANYTNLRANYGDRITGITVTAGITGDYGDSLLNPQLNADT
jgi:hypothetical protein